MTTNSFSEILNQEFRWPKLGDQLFLSSNIGLDNAVVAKNSWARMHFMAEGYKRAADLLVDQAIKSRPDRDFLLYPIVFSYRHYIELILKTLIADYGPMVGVEPDWSCHQLETLWPRLREILDLCSDDHDNEALNSVEACIAEFAKIDPGSFTFRYPKHKSGKAINIDFEHLDLGQLKTAMESIANFFIGTDGWLDNLKSAIPSP